MSGGREVDKFTKPSFPDLSSTKSGAHAYPVERAAADPFQSKEINYHYLLVEVDRRHLKATMNRLDLSSGKAIWTQPDSIAISLPAAKTATASQ